MKTIRQLFLLVIMITGTSSAYLQNVGINTTGAAPNSSAMLDIASTTSGLLVPRMTDAQRIAIASPATGLLVFQTNAQVGYWYFDGTIWVSLCSNSLYNNMYQVPGTAGVTLSVIGTFVALPGLSQTVTLTGNAKVYLHMEAGLQTTSAAAAGFTVADFVIAQNGFFLTDGGYQRITALNNTGLGSNLAICSMDAIVTLGPGTYTFAGYAAKNLGANGVASGDNTSVLQGILDVMVVYQ